LGLGKIPREAWRQDSKEMKNDLYFLAWQINNTELESLIVSFSVPELRGI